MEVGAERVLDRVEGADVVGVEGLAVEHGEHAAGRALEGGGDGLREVLAGPARLRLALQPPCHLEPGLRARGHPGSHPVPAPVVLVELAHHRVRAEPVDLLQECLRRSRGRSHGERGTSPRRGEDGQQERGSGGDAHIR